MHHDALTLVRRDLDRALQDTAARFDDRWPELDRMPGSLLAAVVRSLFADSSALRVPGTATLRCVETPAGNDAVHLFDDHGVRFRIRKRPFSVTLPGHPLRAAMVEMETLFGPEASMAGYEMAVLWEPDYKAKALGRTVLAVVEGIDDVRKTVIHWEAPLPVLPPSGPAREDMWDDDEFNEDFDEGEEGVGPS